MGSQSKHVRGRSLNFLCLLDGADLIDAVKLADQEMCFGGVEKGSTFQPRRAIRFKATADVRKFASDHSIPDFSAFGPWKLLGII